MYELQLIDAKAATEEIAKELQKSFSSAQLSILLQKTPKEEVKKRLLNPGKEKNKYNPELSYVEHAYVEETLNFAFMFRWSAEVVSKERIDNEALVEIVLTIVLPDGTVVKKSGFGGHKRIEKNANDSWANTFNSAYSKAIKVAASKIGVGLDLYREETKTIAKTEDNITRTPEYSQENDPISTKAPFAAQLTAISNLGGNPDDVKTYRQAVEMIESLKPKKG